jgi:hypothetical protein
MDDVKKVLLVVVATLLSALHGVAQNEVLTNGTLIITLTSQDTIWIGADSRTSSLTDTGYTVNKKGMCKIYSTNDIVYAMAGHVRYVDNSFNFLNIMQTSINEQQDFEKSMEEFQQRAKAKISSILKKFSRKSINTLIKTNGGSFLSVVAVSFTNGEKKMKEMKFSLEAKNKSNWSIIYKTRDDNGVGSLKFVGHGATASRFVRDNNLYFGNGRNMPEKISDLIELESKATSTVGMPADVISIYNGGYKRVINSGLCSE